MVAKKERVSVVARKERVSVVARRVKASARRVKASARREVVAARERRRVNANAEEKIASARRERSVNARRLGASARRGRDSVSVGMEKAIATADMKEAIATADMKEAIATAGMEKGIANTEKATANMEKATAGMEKAIANTEKATANMEKATANMEKAIANAEMAIARMETATASTRRRKRSASWESWSDSLVFNKHSLKWSRSSSSRVLRVSRRLSSLFLLLLLLLHNPLPTWNHHPSHPLALNRSKLPSSLSPVQRLLASREADIITLTALVRQSLRNLEIGVISSLQHQEHLLRLGTTPQFTMQRPPVREIHHQTARETALRSRLRYQLHLLGGFGIELDDGSIPYQ